MSRRLHLANIFLMIIAFSAATITFLPTDKYVQVDLASDVINLAENIDSNLVNPWGIVQTPSGEWWVANNRDGVLLRLTGEGMPDQKSAEQTITVTRPEKFKGLRSNPTGLVYNTTEDFLLTGKKPAQLITATQDGTIAAWNPENGNQAAVVVDKSSLAVYTGIALGKKDGKNFLYAANFRTAGIDVFDTYFHQVQPDENAFIHPAIPPGYAPFNLLYHEGKLYVLYAYQDADRYNPSPGVGDRFISVYDMAGKLVKQLNPEQGLSAAWGIAWAPVKFGKYGNMLLLGNPATGAIAVVDPDEGSFRGYLKKPDGFLVTIPGVRGMAFDRADKPAEPDRLYFCAGIDEGRHGLFGFVRPEP